MASDFNGLNLGRIDEVYAAGLSGCLPKAVQVIHPENVTWIPGQRQCIRLKTVGPLKHDGLKLKDLKATKSFLCQFEQQN